MTEEDANWLKGLGIWTGVDSPPRQSSTQRKDRPSELRKWRDRYDSLRFAFAVAVAVAGLEGAALMLLLLAWAGRG